MFYQADKIETILICNVCDRKMVDPRLLPCGKSVCNRCVDFLTDAEKKKIKCKYCCKEHEIPDGGFYINQLAQEMLKCEAKAVFRSNHTEEFKKLLETLNATKQSIESTLECGDAKIRDHCDKVRNDMELAIEQAHEKLDEIHKDFMDEIDDYEKECQEKFKLIQQNKVDIDKALNDSNELLSKSNHLLQQFKIDQTQLSKLFESAQSLLIILEQLKDEIQRDMFNESLLKFEKQITFDSNVIGKIVKQNIELYFLENIENMQKLDFNHNTKWNIYFHILQPFKFNGFMFLCSEKYYLNLVCFDKNGKSLFEKKDLIKNKKIEEFTYINFASSKTNKIAFICTGEKYLNLMDMSQ
jgi:hypothetical protein